MEHLDLAGVISTPTNWLMPAFDQQDAIYLSSSRQMLEPILEETSEDEEHAQNSWNQYEHATSFWSSAESETGSVIRIEVNKDPDSISERDFACPAKRARRSEEFLIGGPLSQLPQQQPQQALQQLLQVPNSLEDVVQLRKHQRHALVDYNDTTSSLERFLAYEACSRDSLGTQRSSTGSRRLDDFYSDSDSLSYHSLSRSSSLIQFESLERQLLLNEQHASMNSLGNSSPSLLSCEGASPNAATVADEGARSGGNSGSNSGNNSRRGSQSSLLKRFETSDGRLHQTYLDLDKLNFDDEQRMLFGASKSNLVEAIAGEVKSDSESSTTSSSGHSILTASKPSVEDLTDSSISMTMSLSSKTGAVAAAERMTAFQRGGKNSAENLSEDSGYCEPATLRRAKSKSIPKNFEKFCEEEEEFEFEQYERIKNESKAKEDEEVVVDEDEEDDDAAQNTHSKNSNIIHHYDIDRHDICQPKINDATFTLDSSSSSEATFNEPTKPPTAAPPPEQEQSPSSPSCQCFVKNNPTREHSSSFTHEQRRSLAHSPSPVSSVASSGSSSSSSGDSSRSTRSSMSASTCASAASFTWHLPTQTQQSRTPAAAKQTLGEFCSMLRNSLPDIRDALGSETYFLYNHHPAKVNAFNGYVLDHSKAATGVGVGATPTTTKAKVHETDDSDISTSIASSSSAAHDSRSDATDIESTPETRKRIVGGGGGGGIGGTGSKGNQRALRQSSVPNELDKLGRRKRVVKSKYSKSSTEESTSSNSSAAEDEEEQDFFDDSCLKIRRSCSWSERRNWRNLQRFEEALENDNRRGEEPPQSLGYMNASYQNLTLLDYSGNKSEKNQAYYKRSSYSEENMDTHKEKRKSGADYESLICKDNFLLDELSEIYDKNASILNDRRVGDEAVTLEVDRTLTQESLKLALDTQPSTSPKPLAPPRQRKHSNSSYSDLDGLPEEENVQHVQLTIRKPPARQKHGRKSEGTNSLTSDQLPTPTFGTFGKPTFDQDPTNLRTSYAQSLEKCNFDAKELSNTDLTKVRSLPKRRFHAQAACVKKKNMVSSTPNLNAFDPGADEIEDDIYVSSAHTSMHQLPQSVTAQKPLGILLPAGSRTSFSKEVSFCPVVSKYCWQEQSSEECNEPALSRQQAQEEESDDELLDNADATVIYNTKENEQIAARYKEENAAKIEREQQNIREQTQLREQPQIRAQPTQEPIIQENEPNIAAEEHKKTSQNEAIQSRVEETSSKYDSNEAQAVDQAIPATPIPSEVSLKPTIVAATTIQTKQFSSDATHVHNSGGVSSKKTDQQQRPLSIQLPILSEPPTNRAHHILYASQQMLDNLQRREREELEQEYIKENRAGARAVQTKALSVSNLNTHGRRNNGMFHYTDESLESGGVGAGGLIKPNSNNNNELAKSKFKADEKHPSSKGFLSRFTNGFRFSLRRNKKKQLQQQKDQLQQQEQQQSEQPNGGVLTKHYIPKESQNKSGQLRSPDFIYIPLKGPLLAGSRAVSNATVGAAGAAVPPNGNATGHNDSICSEAASTTSTASASSAAAKIGAKSNGNQLSQTSTLKVTGKPPLPKLPPRTVSMPQHQQQQQQQSAGPGHAHQAPPAGALTNANFTPQQRAPSSKFYTDDDFLAAERTAATAYHYDDFANQLNSGMQANGSVSGVGLATEFTSPSRASVSQKTQMFNQMGGGAQAAHNPFGHNKIGLIETNLDTHETVISGKTRSLMDIGPQGGKRLNVSHHGAGGDYNIDDEDVEDDDDVYVDGGAGVGSVLVKSKPLSGGGQQIASVRRPHKSMEFLLDKENQKNVLRSTLSQDSSKFHTNPAYFSPRDLSIFVDSIEKIASIQRAKYERRQLRKAQKLITHRVQEVHQYSKVLHRECDYNKEGSVEYCSPVSSNSPSADEAEDEPILYLEAKNVAPPYVYDEAYCSQPGSSNNSPRNSAYYENCDNQAIQHIAVGRTASSTSDSDDSGVIGIQTIGDHVRPHGVPVITKTKSLSKRSRIIDMVLKRDYQKATPMDKSKKQQQQQRQLDQQQLLHSGVESASSPDENLSPLSFEEQVERLDSMLDEVNNHQYESIATITKPKKKEKKSRRGIFRGSGSSEEHFLDKALRFLTL